MVVERSSCTFSLCPEKSCLVSCINTLNTRWAVLASAINISLRLSRNQVTKFWSFAKFQNHRSVLPLQPGQFLIPLSPSYSMIEKVIRKLSRPLPLLVRASGPSLNFDAIVLSELRLHEFVRLATISGRHSRLDNVTLKLPGGRVRRRLAAVTCWLPARRKDDQRFGRGGVRWAGNGE